MTVELGIVIGDDMDRDEGWTLTRYMSNCNRLGLEWGFGSGLFTTFIFQLFIY
jgi:hypothetical protein